MSEIAVQQKLRVFGSHVATGMLSTYHDIAVYRNEITSKQLFSATLMTEFYPTLSWVTKQQYENYLIR
jgi:hypothetical protein